MSKTKKTLTLRERFDVYREATRAEHSPPVTWKTLAELLHVARPYLYAVLNGEKVNPRPWFVKNMAEMLKIPVSEVARALQRTKELAARRRRA